MKIGLLYCSIPDDFRVLLSCKTICSEQVEEKPDVTYNDVGGCKEQIEKLREVFVCFYTTNHLWSFTDIQWLSAELMLLDERHLVVTHQNN